MKRISFVAPCLNEEDNVGILYERIRNVFEGLEGYDFDILFMDNASTDRTVERLRALAAADKRVRVIVNMRNFGPWRSPLYGLLQLTGDAMILICSDLQDPPELVVDFIREWEKGYKIVAAVKKQSEESWLMAQVRKTYYGIVARIAEFPQLRNFTGYGLYDREVIDLVRSTGDHYIYLRGLIAEMGYDIAQVPYDRPARKHGRTKHSLYGLYIQAMNGITTQSKVPLRVCAFLGFILSTLSLLSAFGYFALKLIFWNSFVIGLAPIVIGLFFFASVQLFFLGVIGEYIGAIHTRLFQKWLVIERERINLPPLEHKPPQAEE